MPILTVRFGDPAGRGRARNAALVRSESKQPARHDHGRLQIEKRSRPFFTIGSYIGRTSLDVVSEGWSPLFDAREHAADRNDEKAG